MLQRRGKALALFRIVAQPVKQLGEAPLGGVNATAPVDGGEALGVRRGGNFGSFFPRAVVAPEIVIVDGVELGINWNHARAGGVERHGFDGVAVNARGGDGPIGSRRQGSHVVGVACVA